MSIVLTYVNCLSAGTVYRPVLAEPLCCPSYAATGQDAHKSRLPELNVKTEALHMDKA